jgi:IMP dehydrogenase
LADGGIRSSGDIVKALAIGADAVILGGLLAGTKETPGKFIEEGGRLYKYYSGMASEQGREGWFDRSKTSFIPEGVATKIPYEGKTAGKVIENLVGGLRSGMSYAGANSVTELRQNAQWVRITQAGYIEGTPHGKRS